MTREDARYYLRSSGFSEEQINTIEQAFKQEPCADWYDVPSDEMTLEQARQAVKDLRKKLVEYLDQEPCDAISRQAMLDINESHHGQMPNHINHQIWQEIKDLPPVTPQPKTDWIPVSERLPEYGEVVITVNSDEDYEINHIIDDDLNEWFYDGVVAWMSLPPCYEQQEGARNDSR